MAFICIYFFIAEKTDNCKINAKLFLDAQHQVQLMYFLFHRVMISTVILMDHSEKDL